jgi:formylglycine-generating enzyme required for sulfatase activity
MKTLVTFIVISAMFPFVQESVDSSSVPLSSNQQEPSAGFLSRFDSAKSNDLGIKWVHVEGGRFRMGNDNGLSPDESPEHEVLLDGFFMSATEITFDQYDRFCEATKRSKPSDNGWGRGTMPVINVNWNDAYEFCQWAANVTGSPVKLPTEAEWEFAARGGTKSRKFAFSGGNKIDDVAWFAENSERKSHQVALKAPNELGIYDMTGNVWEWCADWYSEEYYSVSPKKNPQGPQTGTHHVLRGGSWLSTATYGHVTTRSSLRSDYISTGNGFRVCR